MTTKKIAVTGLGYVGWPLALAFGKRFLTVGYDINPRRVAEAAKAIENARRDLNISFMNEPALIATWRTPETVVSDLKGIWPLADVDSRL